MPSGPDESAIRERVDEYKEGTTWQERKGNIDATSKAIRDLTESIVENYDDRVGTQEMSALRRLCQVKIKKETKKNRVEDTNIPKQDKERVKSVVEESEGIVGRGQANIPIPEDREEDAYRFLKRLVESDEVKEIDEAVNEFADPNIKGVKSGVTSPILFFLHPDRCPVNNGPSRKGMRRLGYEVSNDLDDYVEEAKKFREVRDKYDLGGEEDNLRDVDLFLRDLDEFGSNGGGEFSESLREDPQIFQVPLTEEMRGDFEKTVRSDVPAGDIEDIVSAELNNDVLRLWGSVSENQDLEQGDLLLFGDRENEEYVTAATVMGFKELPEEEAQGFCEAVDWEYSDPYRLIIYLDEVYEIYLDTGVFWKLMGFDGFPNNGFSRIASERVEEGIRRNKEYGEVDIFLEGIASEKIYSAERDTGKKMDIDRTYWLWNTNYEHEDTDGTEAFQRGVAAAYGGEKWGGKLTKPSKGDVLLAYRVKKGVRGVGIVEEETDDQPIDKGDEDVDPIKGPDKLEFHLPVDWLYTLPEEEAISTSESAEILDRGNMSHVATVEKPSNQQGAHELYEKVRQRYMNLNETSEYAEHQNEDIQRLIEDKKQAVFYGPPGTGKTYTAVRFADWLRAKKDANSLGDEQVRTVTFHPSFSYEDFLEGFTASVEDNQVGYDYEKGSFAEIVEDAKEAYESSDGDEKAPPFVLIIDEINRGNLAQIFGETITLLEEDKRLNEDNEISSQLAHSGESFVIPPNLYVIGTMNTADESIALVDTALRRRFRFLSFPPKTEVVLDSYDRFDQKEDLEEAIRVGKDATSQLFAASVLAVEELNERIINIQSLGKGKQIGHTYLFGFETPQDVVDTWRFEVLPQLEEYYFGQFGRMQDELLSEVGSDIIDWDGERIKSFNEEELYGSLCDIAGIPEEERAELAEVYSNPNPTKSERNRSGDDNEVEGPGYVEDLKKGWPDWFLEQDIPAWGDEWKINPNNHTYKHIYHQKWAIGYDAEEPKKSDFVIRCTFRVEEKRLANQNMDFQISATGVEDNLLRSFYESFYSEDTMSELEQILDDINMRTGKSVEIEGWEEDHVYKIMMNGKGDFDGTREDFKKTVAETFDDLQPVFELITECIPKEEDRAEKVIED
jgi:DNA polymerase III delta prime subunit